MWPPPAPWLPNPPMPRSTSWSSLIIRARCIAKWSKTWWLKVILAKAQIPPVCAMTPPKCWSNYSTPTTGWASCIFRMLPVSSVLVRRCCVWMSLIANQFAGSSIPSRSIIVNPIAALPINMARSMTQQCPQATPITPKRLRASTRCYKPIPPIVKR